MDESHLSRQILYDEKDCHQMLPGAVAAAQGIPWMHGACAGSVGMSFTVLPGLGPCFCCFVPRSPAPGELLTCDTAGLMGPAASTVAALEVAQALRVLLGKAGDRGVGGKRGGEPSKATGGAARI
ncbi:MAG: hypothetical protein AB1503_09030 [Bacillota bacterium]